MTLPVGAHEGAGVLAEEPSSDERGRGLLRVVELLAQAGVGGAMHVLRLRREGDLTGRAGWANPLGLSEEPKRETLPLAPTGSRWPERW